MAKITNEPEIETNLSPYEIYQLYRFGNILNNYNPEEEFESDKIYTSEAAYIFNQENEPQ